MSIQLLFDRGSLLVENLERNDEPLFPYLKWDERVQKHRCYAHYYRTLVLGLREHKKQYDDKAKNFSPTAFVLKKTIHPRPYQQEALAAWTQQGSKGLVVLPTGAGKTIFALLSIAHTQRPTLVHVPTLDLMHQWYEVLSAHFDAPIGLLGGGYNDEQLITVATYDSALIHVNHKGNKFGLLVFDECHHLPSEQNKLTASCSLAPFRLGITATPEMDVKREAILTDICGPCHYQIQIHELAGNTLSPYEVVTLEVKMEPEEKKQYLAAREVYLSFLKENRIYFSAQNKHSAWQLFLRKAHQNAKGKAAFQAYLTQKKLSQSAKNKENHVWDILMEHKGERILIFTQDNATAYALGEKFCLPVLTHHTKVKERQDFLDSFRSGVYKVLVTSKVLNEGIDVPEASIAVVVSGSGSVREHVQRLGRILRAKEGKKAILYELVSAGTGEYFVNERRREHSAYKERMDSV